MQSLFKDNVYSGIRRASVVCITSGHLCTSPRVVREADALVRAGFDVTVISALFMPDFVQRDSRLSSIRAWQWRPVMLDAISTRVELKLKKQLARIGQWVAPGNASINANSHNAMHARLAATAMQQPASVYVGHNLPGLVAAVIAGNRTKTPVIFDVEDWHPGEVDVAGAVQDKGMSSLGAEATRRLRILDAYIPFCSGLLASSPLIGELLAQRYSNPIEVICNVGDVAALPVVIERRRERIKRGSRRCYWYSQTVGHDRGLEEIIPLLANSHRLVSLTVQGAASLSIQEKLSDLWSKSGGRGDITFKGLADPTQLAVHAGGFDIGLSVETNRTLNRRLCLPNKLFSYLEWGMPQILSNTPSQALLAREIKTASVLVDFDKPRESEGLIRSWLSNSERLCEAVCASERLFTEKFNYQRESVALVELINRVRRLSTNGSARNGLSVAA